MTNNVSHREKKPKSLFKNPHKVLPQVNQFFFTILFNIP